MKQNFTSFLLNEGRTETLTQEHALAMIDKHCSNYLKNAKRSSASVIYRGIRSGSRDHFLYGDSSLHTRESANTTNHYTMLVDHMLPSWKPYPNRSESFICTTARFAAGAYGIPYTVFPYDGTTVGICPRSDFWNSFPKLSTILGIDSMNHFNELLEIIYNEFVHDELKSVSNKSEFFHNLDKLNKVMLKKSKEEDLRDRNYKYRMTSIVKFIDQWYKHSKNILTMLDELMDPELNGFALTKSDDILINTNAEVWFAGPAIFLMEGLEHGLELF